MSHWRQSGNISCYWFKITTARTFFDKSMDLLTKPAVLRDSNEERTSAELPEYIVSLSFLPVLSYATLLSDILKRFVNFNHRAVQKSSWKSLIVEYSVCMYVPVYCKLISSPTSTKSPTVSDRESHRYS